MSDLDLADLVEHADLDELVRTVDRLCDDRAWDALVELRDRCRWALERGKQLWPAATFAEYRIARDAPGRWAASVITDESGWLALGPLSEVAASTHPWAELADHLAPTPAAAFVAHERVVRGEDLRGDDRVRAGVLDLPLVLEPWEPSYLLPIYRADRIELPGPAAVGFGAVVSIRDTGRPDEDVDPIATRALLDVVEPWITGSAGRASAVAVVGDAAVALGALGLRRARLAAVDLATAVAHLAWAGASGGAQGRRRGAAAGRFAAWWALAGVTGLLEDWPLPTGELGDAAGELRWYVFDDGDPLTGWHLRLVAEDPDEGLAFAIHAVDASLT